MGKLIAMSRRGGTALAVGALALVLSGCGGFGQSAAEQACGEAVLADWADGSFDRVYADTCYQAALDVMPEDLRAYSTAKDDISRALYSHRTAP
jgi:hypothetical protein